MQIIVCLSSRMCKRLPPSAVHKMTNDQPLDRFRGHSAVPSLTRDARKKLITMSVRPRDAAIAVFECHRLFDQSPGRTECTALILANVLERNLSPGRRSCRVNTFESHD